MSIEETSTPSSDISNDRIIRRSLFIVGGLIACAIGTLILFTPFDQVDQRPRIVALAISATATSTSTPTATSTPTITPTFTITPSPTVTPTPTITPTPTPQPTPDFISREFYIPILMYHYISIPPNDADPYRKELSITPDVFRQHMQWLKDHDYQTITLEQLIYALNIGWPPLPAKPVILTFDDGYSDNYENAYPIIKEMGFTATFFILTDVTDRNAPGYMTWDMLREMARNGMSIQVHGREHLEMANKDRDWLVYHLLGSAQTIEAELGYIPRFLAYPSGKYDENVIASARQLGYWGGATTIFGSHQRKETIFELERLRVSGNMALEYFSAMLEGY